MRQEVGREDGRTHRSGSGWCRNRLTIPEAVLHVRIAHERSFAANNHVQGMIVPHRSQECQTCRRTEFNKADLAPNGRLFLVRFPFVDKLDIFSAAVPFYMFVFRMANVRAFYVESLG